MAARAAWTDERAEQAIGQLLRAGVVLSAAIVSIGAVLYLIHHGGERPNYRSFQSEPAELRSIAGIASAAAKLQPRGFIQLGLVALLLTPVARVLFSIFAFAAERDWTYVIVTLIVLAILIASIGGYI
jgi:uncharacterized membrane protein